MSSQQRKSYSDLKVTTEKGYSKSIQDLLNNTVLGTPGKLRYKHTETEKNIEKLSNLSFIQIKKRERVLGTAGFIERNITLNDTFVKALYVRYLSVYNPFKNLGNSKTNIKPDKKPNALRSSIEEIFNRELEKPFKSVNQTGIYYAYVEADNLLSFNLCKSFGFKPIRIINTFLFSRFFPKEKKEISVVKKERHSAFRESLHDFYRDHNFVFSDSLDDYGSCFELKKNEEAIAGIRAIPVHWKIIELPGLKGFLMLKILPRIPLFKKLFNPEELRFLAFDSLWYKEGNSDKISDLMEHACALLDYNLGMVWQDEESLTAKEVLSSNNLGILHKLNGKVSAHLKTREINMSKENYSALKNKPAFVSAIDMI